MASSILRWLGTALILLAALLLLLLSLGSHLQLVEARKLVAGGRQVDGTVTALVAPRRSTAYRYSYAYSVGNASYARADQSIPHGMKDEVRPGTRIRVWYDPASPELATTAAELAEQESWANRIIFPVAGFALLGWGIARMLRRRATARG